MATEILRTRTNCTVCDKAFSNEPKNSTPKVLTCAHTFCEECVEGNISETKFVPCPKCERETYVGDVGVDTLSKNDAVLEYLDDLKKNPPESVATCGNCNEKPVAVFCPECNTEICESCSNQVHSLPMFKNHNPTSDLKPKTENNCKEHNEKLVMFCHSDEVPICYLCKEFGPHQGHQTKLLTEAAKDGRDAALGAQQEVEEIIKHISVMAQKSANSVEMLEQNYKTTQDKIHEHFDKLADALEHRREELITMSTSVKEENTQKLRDQSLGLVTHLSTLSLVSEDTSNLVEKDDLTFLRGKNKLKDNIQKELRKAEGCELDILAGATDFLNILDVGIFETMHDHGAVGAKSKDNVIKIKLEAKRKRKAANARRIKHQEERIRMEEEESIRATEVSKLHGEEIKERSSTSAAPKAPTRKSGAKSRKPGGPHPPSKPKPTKGKATPRPPKKPKKSKHKRTSSKANSSSSSGKARKKTAPGDDKKKKVPSPERPSTKDDAPPLPQSPAPMLESDDEPPQPLPPTRASRQDYENEYKGESKLEISHSEPMEHQTLGRPTGPRKKKKPTRPKLNSILEL